MHNARVILFRSRDNEMDFISDVMSVLGPDRDGDGKVFDQVSEIIDNGGHSDEAPYACERVIKSAWEHAARMTDDPASVARSLPWNALPVSRGSETPENNNDDGSYLQRLVGGDSTILWDSDCGYYGFSDEKMEVDLTKGKAEDDQCGNDDDDECREDFSCEKGPVGAKKYTSSNLSDDKLEADLNKGKFEEVKCGNDSGNEETSCVECTVGASDVSNSSSDKTLEADLNKGKCEEGKYGNDTCEEHILAANVASTDKKELSCHKERGKRLTGEQLYKDHYVDRYLPGVVESHPKDNRPVNAIAWSGLIDRKIECIDPEDDDSGGWEHYKELARTHPGDETRDHEQFSQEKSSAKDYSEKDFCPTVTKAGSRLWSISFAAPKSKQNDAQCVDMKAVYPGQITIRYDIGRDLLIYDMFDFKPITIHEFPNMRANGEGLCTEAELEKIERLSRFSAKRKWGMFYLDHQLAAESTSQERIHAIGEEKFCHLLNYVRFKASQLKRIRFSLRGLSGVRVIELNCKRPNSDIPPSKGSLSISQLGGPGKNGTDQRHNTFEKCDDKIETLGMLVLEFGDKCGISLTTAHNKHPFASTTTWPPNWRDRKRLPVEDDWTRDKIFSKCRRHYIIGDLSEMMELANFLMDKSSRVFNMLNLPPDDQHASVRKLFNSLSGDVSILSPDQTPSDTYADLIKIEKMSSPSSSTPTLTQMCVDVLIQTSVLKDEARKKGRYFETADDVHEFLRRGGIENPTSANMCFKAGLLNGNMCVPRDFLEGRGPTFWLDLPMLGENDQFLVCGGKKFHKRDALHQGYVGAEFNEEEMMKDPNFFGMFVTDICQGKPRWDRKNHNHCTKCPGFGRCIGYYKNCHCDKCGEHHSPVPECGLECKCQIKSAGDAGVEKSADSWDGMIKGCLKQNLIEGIRKKEKMRAEGVHRKEIIKDLRERLLVIQTSIAMETSEKGNSQLAQRLKNAFSDSDCYEEIVNRGCHMNLDRKSLLEICSIKLELIEIMGT